jgi:NTE family protein
MRIGLTLSGGGARGIVHLGVIKALEEFGVVISQLSGTSAGAIVGALYSYGHTPDEILKLISSTSFFRSLRPAWTLTGLLSLDKLRDILLTHLPDNTFGTLKIPLTVAVTDIRKARGVYFSAGELVPAILASCCIPAIFNPIHFNGEIYVDGGIVDNLPTKSIRDKCDFLIGSHCNYISPEVDIKNIRKVIERSLLMAINGNTVISKSLCDILIEPTEVGRISAFEIGRAKDLFDIGYKFTRQNFTAGDFELKLKM